MPKKIIIDTEDMDFRGFKDFERMPHHMKHMVMRQHVTNEVKLFTDKNEMVAYVNQLEDIKNVEIFKIEDDLYKVLVTKIKKHEGKCCKEDEDEEDEE